MDPFSAEGELVNIHTAFIQAQYQTVVDFDTADFSTDNQLPARVLKLRAQLALGQHDEVISAVSKDAASSPDLAAVLVLAQHLKKPEDEAPKEKALELSKSQGDNLSVQLCAGTVLANTGEREEALALLAKHQGSLDAVALITQIHLSTNRLDLATRTVSQARGWSQDALLVNLAESWVNLRRGCSQNYQSAFYVFEELATAPSTSSPSSILAQAICELHLGRTPEAEAAMASAVQAAEGKSEEALVKANKVVLDTILGKRDEARKGLEELAALQGAGASGLLAERERRREAFQSAMGKYNPKFEIET